MIAITWESRAELANMAVDSLDRLLEHAQQMHGYYGSRSRRAMRASMEVLAIYKLSQDFITNLKSEMSSDVQAVILCNIQRKFEDWKAENIEFSDNEK